MKIELESPFKERWKSGYLQIHPNSRKYICLFNSRKDRSLISYARYLMSVHLGRMLEKHEHVDHKDEDKTNDVIDNLQILTQEENNKKRAKHDILQGKVVVLVIECPVCQKEFRKRQSAIKVATSRNPDVVITCSRSCSAKLQIKKQGGVGGSNKKILSKHHHDLIVELRSKGNSDYKISVLTGIKRQKIQRRRKEHSIP